MYRFFLFLCFGFLSLTLHSQTVHAIIFANTECPGNPRNPLDNGIGPSVTCDYYRIKIEMTTIASFIGYDLKSYYYVGGQDKFCKENLDKVLDGLKCSPQDLVFFYYSGHGGRSSNEQTRYPQMNLVVDPYHSDIAEGDANYPIYNVLQRIKKKNPRLTVVIGDLCNSLVSWVTPKPSPMDKVATQVDDYPIKVYKDLFLKMKGSVIAVSSEPGQASIACQEGGAFTLGILHSLQNIVSNQMEPSWKNLFENCIAVTEEMTQGGQTPIFDASDLCLVTEEIQTQPVEVVVEENPVEETQLTITQDEQALSELLTRIGDESLNEEKRIQLSVEALPLLFESPRAAIKVVGKDGKTIVSTKTASAYLDWLTVTTGLYKVVPVKGILNSDYKFTFLQVHEMHK